MEYTMYNIPIYLIDEQQEDDHERDEMLGMKDSDIPQLKQGTLRTLFIDTYLIDPDRNDRTRTRDILFFINGASFRTPYSQQIINEVIHPAMRVKAMWGQSDSNINPPIILGIN